MASASARPVRHCGERDVVWNWVRAEMESRSFGEGYRLVLSPGLESKLWENRRSELTEKDWEELRAVLGRIRGNYATPLLELKPDWCLASLPATALPFLIVANHPPLTRIAPSRLLGDYAKALEAGVETAGDTSAGRYRHLRQTFNPAKMNGVPILAAEREEGPYHIAEGLTRLSVQTTMQAEGKGAKAEITVILGVCPELKKWRWA